MQTKESGSPVHQRGSMLASARGYYALSRTDTRRLRRFSAGRAAPILTLILLAGAALPVSFALAGDTARPPITEAPPPPPLLPARPSAPAGEPETGLEPEITITTRGETTHEEYRINGRLYMIKVIPKRGKPYYLIDDQGDGQFRRSDLETRIAVPNWVIKSW